jgi:hypothetical protein
MHALIVGGTGMLRGVMEHYRRSFKVVSILARSKKDLEKLEKRYPGIIRGIAVDYEDETALRMALKESTDKNGRYDLAVIWVQDASVDVPLCIAEFVGTPESKGKLVHVRGSSAADPAMPARSMADSFAAKTLLSHQEVILGFMKEGEASRWLDHEEITQGILDAIDKGEAKTIVGTVTPWNERPKEKRS